MYKRRSPPLISTSSNCRPCARVALAARWARATSPCSRATPAPRRKPSLAKPAAEQPNRNASTVIPRARRPRPRRRRSRRWTAPGRRSRWYLYGAPGRVYSVKRQRGRSCSSRFPVVCPITGGGLTRPRWRRSWPLVRIFFFSNDNSLRFFIKIIIISIFFF